MQQGDVLFQQTINGGEIDFSSDGLILFSGGLDTACYLSLFGANEQDDGSDGNPRQWWGNCLETEPVKKLRGLTGYLLRSIAAVPFNLKRIESAVKVDLSWLKEIGAVSSIDVSTRIPARDSIEITVDIKAVGLESRFTFVENWKAR